ncbi:MAG TPA: sodium ion-translocating decarboxylase subunit beta [Anaerolineaceae bacterium]|nr:sodium ion-translocating decarboxylase subunit beta [Anaerolineaceae bacterium]
MDFTQVIGYLIKGFTDFTWANGVMIALGCVLVYLAVAKEIEPVLLLPIGVGCVFANLGMSAYQEGGWMYWIYQAGIATELFPLLICGRGCHDRLPPAAGAAQAGAAGRGGSVWHLWHPAAGSAAGLPDERSRLHWRHRSH